MNEITPKHYTDILTFALTVLWDGVEKDALSGLDADTRYVCLAISEGADHYFETDQAGQYYETELELARTVGSMVTGEVPVGTIESVCRKWNMSDDIQVQAVRKALTEALLAHYHTGTTEKPKNSLLREIIENFKQSKTEPK